MSKKSNKRQSGTKQTCDGGRTSNAIIRHRPQCGHIGALRVYFLRQSIKEIITPVEEVHVLFPWSLRRHTGPDLQGVAAWALEKRLRGRIRHGSADASSAPESPRRHYNRSSCPLSKEDPRGIIEKACSEIRRRGKPGRVPSWQGLGSPTQRKQIISLLSVRTYIIARFRASSSSCATSDIMLVGGRGIETSFNEARTLRDCSSVSYSNTLGLILGSCLEIGL